ncbi:hypothetical protein BDV95DRAFT_593207 [Massariosphaeria phaeospora]|uniref:Heme peroxidase n=1 Tax=Massariosphaeria phaeospora TaxID=100035 RepID=A0A7C8I9C1_9PLEO|nr:hypothetical protein BDV95DRAFT_593207 [Massariosphaeria phaeospora]
MIWNNPASIALLLACRQYGAAAQPTWPASTDELEDIMMLNTGYRARGFAAGVTPCSTGLGPGRNTAAEWLRTAFHDMAPGSVYTHQGGLDGSIAFEIKSGENIGAAFASTIQTYAPFFSSRTSLADVISAGVYTATRSCGGPVVPIRGGRKDATTAGPQGVPQPQNAIGTFKNQFLRIGFNETEMIMFTACGHTLGGVHAADFPLVLAQGTAPNDYGHLDSTVASFDSKIATEYVSGTTKDPMVVGVSQQHTRNSDHVVFQSDKNVTIRALQDPTYFADTCKSMFQKMVEVVPSGVTLTDPVTPYEIKPYDVQLTLLASGTKIKFSGDIRVRTNQRAVASVKLIYKDRTGAAVTSPIDTTPKGDAAGFDDSFSFYGFSTELPADKSISSFNVAVDVGGGTIETWDNNGNGFRVDDTVLYQTPQSCLDGSGKLTVVAAVRNGASSPNLQVIVKNPRPSPVAVPALSTTTAAMTTQSAVGSYQLYSADYTFSGSQAESAMFNIVAGSASDKYKTTKSLPAACKPLSSSTPTPSSSSSASQALSQISSVASSPTPTPTPPSSAFAFQGCYYDPGNPRALTGAATFDSMITVEKCATFCSSYQFFGLEYSRECYCGNTKDELSVEKSLSDCNMPCGGDSSQLCGAGNRLSFYKNSKYTPPGNSKVSGYKYNGCYSEGTNRRALSDTGTSSDSMTVETCATFCNGAKYFGVEYGKECYCGSVLNAGSVLQGANDCAMVCAGSSTQYCGAGDRLNIYEKGGAASNSETPSSSVSSTVSALRSTIVTAVPTSDPTPLLQSSTAAPSTTPTNGPSLAGFVYEGCMTDLVEKRTIVGKTRTTDENSYESCAAFCDGFQFFGVEYGSECYCSDSIRDSPEVEEKDDSECTMPCTGDPTQACGGPSRITVFKSLKPFTGRSNPVISGYDYAGCFTDSPQTRVLDDDFLFDSAMTIAKCATYCRGSKFFGTQYGAECYCGAELASPSDQVSEADCSFQCGGTKTEKCGAGSRLSLWQRTDPVPRRRRSRFAPAPAA